jgi:glycosyltransferase involved in cell wall biosynthesis
MTAPAAIECVRPSGHHAPRVSVIVPLHNLRQHVREAVISLLAQTWHDLEVVVIDDASSDGSLDVLQDIQDPRLALFRLPVNAGLSGARNAGIAVSRGEFIALLDADDVSLPGRIEAQLRVLLARPEVGLVGCLVNRIDLEGRVTARGADVWGLEDEALKPLMLFTNPFPAVYMLRRSAIPAGGFRAMYAEDYALAADVARHHGVALVREALVNYRVSPGGIMQTKLDQVARDALVTQSRLLQDLGMSPEGYDPSLMAALMHFGRQPSGALSFERMLALRQWMQDIEQANARSGHYPPDALARAMARAWELVLLHATKLEGMRFGRRYAVELLMYRASLGRRSVRARALLHGLLNTVRRPQAAT